MRSLLVRHRLCSLLLLLLGATLSHDLAAQQASSFNAADLDTTCAPCQDFFQFANGGWLKRTVIPGDQPAWGAFNELQEQNYQELHDVLDQAAAQAATTRDPGTRTLGTFYGACMDTVRIEAAGVAPLAADLKAITAIRNRREVQRMFARLARYQISVPFSFHSTPDLKNSSRVIAEVSQSGLGLPDRDYYTREDSASQALRLQYTDHIGRMLRLLGDDSAAADRSGQIILGLETVLARASMTQLQLRDPDSTYHRIRLADLQKLTPAFSWNAYLGDLGQRGVTEANVAQPAFLRVVDSIYRAAPVDDWKTYLRWHLLTSSAAALSRPFDTENFRFYSTVLQGIKEMRPRWKRCLARTDDAMGELLGQAYVAQHFTPEAKAKALDMVHNILAEFRHRLAALEWMSDATKGKAYTKLDAIVTKIGYPDRWRDYRRLVVEPNAYLANLHHAEAFEVARDLGKIGQPLDRTEWPFSPPTVNAGYEPSLNDIVFPAGILQPPFFDPAADDATNYGAMGAGIGHEITHGFDDQGRKFDALGNLSGWWSPDDEPEFTARAEVVAAQYDGYVVLDTLHVNGHLTLGENIADLGGLLIAYGAYRRSLEGKPEPAPIDGYTASQRFFLSFARLWREADRPEFARLLINLDPHSPPRFRANGSLSNLPEFAQAFGCKAGDAMVRDPQAKIW